MSRARTKTVNNPKKKMTKSTSKNKTNRDGSVNAKKLVKNTTSNRPKLKLPTNALKKKSKK